MKTLKAVALMVFLAVILSGCGGGGGGSTTSVDSPATNTVSGTAATGAALANKSVALKDKSGTTKTTTTDVNGKYSIDATGMTAPFLLKVYDNTNALYGVAAAAGTANIHQFTDLIIKNWYKVQGTTVDAVFSSTGAISVPTATEINTIEATIRQILATWLQSVGLDPNSFNLISTPFTAGSAGFDKVLDALKVNVSGGNISITPVDSTGTSGDPIITIPETSNLSTGANPLQDAITGVNTTLGNFANVVTTKGQALAGTDLVGLYDANYLNDGVVGATAGAAAQAGNSAGLSVASLTVNNVISFDSTNSIITVSGIATYTKNGTLHSNEKVWSAGISFKKGVDGAWRFYGNQRPVAMQFHSGVRKMVSSGVPTLEKILPMYIYPPTGTITSITVSGPSLASNPTTFTKNTETVKYKGVVSDTFFLPNDNPVAIAPAIGSVYTFTLTKAAGGTTTFKQTLKETTTETFNITSPTSFTLADAKLGSPLNVSWSLPSTFAVDWITLIGSVNNYGCRVQINPDSTSTTGTITLPATCNSQTVTNANIAVYIHGTNGEVSKVDYRLN